MAYITKEKFLSKDWFKAYLLIVIGSFIMAAGFVLFISPYKLAPGGVYGIAIMLHHLFELPIGVIGLAIDIPLTIIAIKILGPRFGVKTVVGFVLLSGWISLLEFSWGYEPLVEGDPLLSSIFGALLLGFGLGLIFRSKASSGGSDIIAMILSKYTRLPVGQLLIAVDASIVLVALVAFDDWKIPLYSWIVIFITGKVIDAVIQGVNYEKTCIIVSEKSTEIKEKILTDLNRGGTVIPAKGMYSGSEKEMIYTVVNRREVAMLEDFIREIDENAFMTVINANEIFGNGFKSYGDKQV
ncbi:MAG: YitT family protein [Marinilabiliales bacterium]|nr:MAG: YitT family protein [Marinilabiliales bacterium]